MFICQIYKDNKHITTITMQSNTLFLRNANFLILKITKLQRKYIRLVLRLILRI